MTKKKPHANLSVFVLNIKFALMFNSQPSPFGGQSSEWCHSVSSASLQHGIFCALSELGACLGTSRRPLVSFASVSLVLVKALESEPVGVQ